MFQAVRQLVCVNVFFALSCPGVALSCVVDLNPYPGTSVGIYIAKSVCLESRVSWVRIPPRAALFFPFSEKSCCGSVELPLTLMLTQTLQEQYICFVRVPF